MNLTTASRSAPIDIGPTLGVLAGALLWLGCTAWLRPLFLPDEGRYVGVAWEMLRSGDWFTPTLEMDLCGHATLAPAHVIFRHLGYRAPIVRFQTRSGLLTVSRNEDLLIPPNPVVPDPHRDDRTGQHCNSNYGATWPSSISKRE